MLVAETLEQLRDGRLAQILLIGLGNSLRKDDGIGPFLAEALSKNPNLMVENAGDRPERAIDFVDIHRPQKVVFLDAADFGGKPGTLRWIKKSELVERSLSSHRLPLSPLIDWIEAEYSTRCQCLGIQAGSMQLGEGLTPEVARSADQIIEWFEDLA